MDHKGPPCEPARYPGTLSAVIVVRTLSTVSSIRIDGRTPMDASYFRALAARRLMAARNSFDLRAVEEFRKLAEEFTLKADELERLKPPTVSTQRGPKERE
jgi:hypothetical protein